MRMSRGSWIKCIFSFLIAFGLCLPLIRIIDLKRLVEVIRSASALWVAAAACSFACYQWLRTERYYLLVAPQGSKGLFFWTISVHTFLNGILPAGLGEGTFVYLLKRIHRISFMKGTSSLICARLIDYSLLCLLFFGVLFWLRHEFDEALLWGMFTVEILLAAVLVFLWLTTFFRKWILEKLRVKSYRISHFFKEFDMAWQRLAEKKCLGFVLAYSVGMWLAMYGFFFSVIHALGFQLEAVNVLFLYLVLFPIRLLPVRGFANFGTHEAAWIAALMALDMGLKEATTLAFSSHILFLLAILTFGLVAPICMGIGWWVRKTSVVSL